MFAGSVSIGTRLAYLVQQKVVMRYRAASMVVLICIALGASFAFAAPQESRPKQQTPAAKQTALTGCVDEQEGRYILISDQTRDVLANLEAEGFPTEGFAKHLGHKVTVRGAAAAASEGARPVFKVRSIETVSDTCGPQQ